MDVYLKYALAIVAVKNNVTSIDEITNEMIDNEIDESLDKLFLYTEDDYKTCDKGRFTFVPKSKLPELLKSYDKIKGKLKISIHLLIDDMRKFDFLKILVNNCDK